MDFLKLFRAFSLTRFHRDLLRASVVLFPLVFTTIFLYEPSFRNADIVSKLIIASSITFICVLCIVFLVQCLEFITGIRFERFHFAFLGPSFFSFSMMIAFYRYINQIGDMLCLAIAAAFHAFIFFCILIFGAFWRYFVGKGSKDAQDTVDKTNKAHDN